MGVISVHGERGDELLGGEPALRDTIAAATRLGVKFSASELGLELGVSPQAMNNRLKALVRMGALVREAVVVPGGGREFAYRVSEANLEPSN
jgi:predicted ArsR family transcriptional regulator